MHAFLQLYLLTPKGLLMAIIKGPFTFTGKLHNLSAYYRKDIGKFILRRPGGPSKKRILNDPRLVRTRENYAEFGACAMATANVRDAIFLLNRLADYNFTSTLNALNKKIQAEDTVSARGERSILLSRFHRPLTGFNLNRRNPFDQLIRHPLTYTIVPERQIVQVHLPKLTRDINLCLPWQHPYFQLIIQIGAAPDVVHTGGSGFGSVDMNIGHQYHHTPWYHINSGSSENVVELPLPIVYGQAAILLSVGIRAGEPGTFSGVDEVPRKGGAKILGTF